MVDIVERKLAEGEVLVSQIPTDEGLTVFQRCFPSPEYQRIPERTWGKLEENSPVTGLCTDFVEHEYAIVCHSKATQRTTLMHTPCSADFQAITAQINYVVSNTPGESLEVVILRGYAHVPWDRPPKAELAYQRNLQEDESSLRGLISRMELYAKGAMLQLTIMRPSRCLETGCIFVDKCTGCITIPLPTNSYDSLTEYGMLAVGIAAPRTLAEYHHFETASLLYCLLSTTDFHLNRFSYYTSSVSYDGQKSTPFPAISSAARALLRYRKIEGTASSENIASHLGESIDTGSTAPAQATFELRDNLAHIRMEELGFLCEVCRTMTKGVCAKCKGAWYCSREHQMTDWKEHRAWCKGHRDEVEEGLKN